MYTACHVLRGQYIPRCVSVAILYIGKSSRFVYQHAPPPAFLPTWNSHFLNKLASRQLYSPSGSLYCPYLNFHSSPVVPCCHRPLYLLVTHAIAPSPTYSPASQLFYSTLFFFAYFALSAHANYVGRCCSGIAFPSYIFSSPTRSNCLR